MVKKKTDKIVLQKQNCILDPVWEDRRLVVQLLLSLWLKLVFAFECAVGQISIKQIPAFNKQHFFETVSSLSSQNQQQKESAPLTLAPNNPSEEKVWVNSVAVACHSYY